MEQPRETGLMPLVGNAPRVLVLGSFPSRTSLEKGWYYANPRNQFWEVMRNLLDLPVLDQEGVPARDYPAFLVRNHISLWDVAASRRFQPGSMDRDLREIRVNDIAGVLRDHPTIACIALNGGKAWTLFPRGTIPGRIPLYRLPSTSPANARHSLAEKIAEWRVILQYL
ncbi:TDG/mug DNA glycosylase family protein [Methanolinea mesophila]|uniref:DNA-deoxyinosine glycosylase n=1 Tax=Methanolinea mesophila TaxID=547055 RepID=UPI001AE0FA3B|nr:DNA-deoxyinosine glycosylase [Methanolinea mesophila]MBP1929037.1 TDG/mug DNA glycosylase family protein [Methanolinea mesophila]